MTKVVQYKIVHVSVKDNEFYAECDYQRVCFPQRPHVAVSLRAPAACLGKAWRSWELAGLYAQTPSTVSRLSWACGMARHPT